LHNLEMVRTILGNFITTLPDL